MSSLILIYRQLKNLLIHLNGSKLLKVRFYPNNYKVLLQSQCCCHNTKVCNHKQLRCFARFVPIWTIEKREKQPLRSDTFSKVATLNSACSFIKESLFYECFSRFLNFTNGTKSHKASQIVLQTCPSGLFSNKAAGGEISLKLILLFKIAYIQWIIM